MALDAEALEQIRAIIAESTASIVGDAVKTHVDQALGGLDKRVETLVRAAIPAPAPPPKDGDDGGPDPKKGKPDPVEAQVRQQREQIEAMKRELAEERAKAQRQKLTAAARDSLIKAGVPADRVGVALKVLGDSLAVDGETMGVKAADRWGEETIQPLDEAIPAFLKTDEGKLFVPPTPARGAGLERGTATAPKNAEGKTDWDKIARSVSIGAIANAT